MSEKPLFRKLRKVDTSQVPAPVRIRIKEEIIQATSPAFFSKLRLKAIRVYDSLVIRASFDPEPVYDSAGNEINYFYALVYELNFNNNIPLQFRVDFTQTGELLRREQLSGFLPGSPGIISCSKATATALADKTNPIRTVTDIYLLHSPVHKTLVWQLSGPLNPKTQTQYVKVIDAYSGRLIVRDFIRAVRPVRMVRDQAIE